MQLEDVTEGELVVPSKLATLLRTDAKEIAWTIGLDESALKRRSSLNAQDTQRRLCDPCHINFVARKFVMI
ncbi:hypothetical protein [Sneathiella limimaris]|uniref:hypothetical protein n=1 Tax=Sneathiella limimaris TaxID=1964213 RepID=UPI00146C7CCA|nr:hypothetical protein [Sneathiella limimaris]